MFRSRNVWEHFLRGLIGFGLLAGALRYSSQLGWWVLVPAGGALLCFRGCPMCWTVGLFETITNRSIGPACTDGSCERKTRTASSPEASASEPEPEIAGRLR